MKSQRFTKHRPEPHAHHEHPDQQERHLAIRRLKWTLLVGLALVLFEAVGSWLSNSLALLADAFHVSADVAAVSITIVASFLAERPQTPKRSYGYYRLEVLAALFNGLLLFGMVGFIFHEAYVRFNSPEEIKSDLMLGVAIVGLLANIIMLLVLKPSHQHNLNVRGAYTHIVGDTISSVAVIVGAVGIYFTGQGWIDAAASLFVSGILMVMAFKLTWDSIHVLLEGTPKHMDPLEIEKHLRTNCPQIVDIHDFHVWEITSHLFAMTAHVEAKVKSLDDTRLLIDEMNALIQKRYGIGHTTFQVEPTLENDLSK